MHFAPRPHVVSVLAASWFVVGCNPQATTDSTKAEAKQAKPHWDYEGKESPDHWGELSKEYEKCKEGEFQSPIDLHAVAKADVDALRFEYRPDSLRIVNNGHTVQVNHQAESRLVVGSHSYALVQYHFHSPSEHTEAGKGHALELHLVHQDEDGNYAVVGVFVEPGDESEAHEPIWSHLPSKLDGEHDYEGVRVDPSTLLPAAKTHYQYHGSLTTPPCTETVTWNVLDEILPMSEEHIEAFRKLYRSNARPVQMRSDWCLYPHPPPLATQ